MALSSPNLNRVQPPTAHLGAQAAPARLPVSSVHKNIPDNITYQPDHGYPGLANLMSARSDAAIFRRFRTLSMLNLLRMQAELHDMEFQLWKTIQEDKASKDITREGYSSDFRLMRDWVEHGDSEQLEQLDEIAKKLEAYENALDRMTRVKECGKPSKRELDFLQGWLDRPDGGNAFLHERESTIYANSNTADFLSLHFSELEDDVFTSFLNGRLLDLYHWIWGHRKTTNPGYRDYGEDKINRIAKICASVIGSVLPTVTVLALFFIRSILNRIAAMIVFTAVFSVALALFTNVRKVDIFTATSTFAAVEVVFIGSTSYYLGGNGTSGG